MILKWVDSISRLTLLENLLFALNLLENAPEMTMATAATGADCVGYPVCQQGTAQTAVGESV